MIAFHRTAPFLRLAVLLLLAAFLPAAPLTQTARAAGLSFTPQFIGDPVRSRQLVFGDLNGDGALDIVQANLNDDNTAPSKYYLNDGTGRYGAGTALGAPANTRSVAVGDLNGDGHLDIVEGNGPNAAGIPSLIFYNNGQGHFGNGIPLGDAERDTWYVAVGDLNGDGHLDIVQKNSGADPTTGTTIVFLNDSAGTGHFSSSAINTPATAQGVVALGDLNNDRFLDITSSGNEGIYVSYNNQHGGFDSSIPIPYGGAVAAGDMNGDGWLDLVAKSPFGVPGRIYLNDQHGGFSAFTSFGDNTTSFGVTVADINGDGAPDIVQPHFGSASQIFLNLNDGTGKTGAGIPYSDAGANLPYTVSVGDVNGDGLLDIAQGSDIQQSVVYVNQGPGDFASGTRIGPAADATSLAVGDMNHDGRLDIVQGSYGGRSMVLFNNGGGAFSTPTPFGEATSTTSVAIGDMDGDGNLDIVQANWGQQTRVFLNNGAGGFSDTGIPIGPPTNPWTEGSVALGDVNGDGKLDIVQGSLVYTQNIVYLNDGNGQSFTPQFFGGQSSTMSVALGDLNGDGALDIVQANNGQMSMVFLNDGRGNFPTGTPLDSAAHQTWSVAVRDMNGDGALDVVESNWGETSAIFLNDGRGNLPTRITFGGANNTESMAVGDINGDGAPDIVQGNTYQQTTIYLNDGHANLARSIFLTGSNDTRSVVLGDMNDDGALDIVQSNSNTNDLRLFPNRMLGTNPLQSALSAVSIGRPGRTPSADFYSSPDLLSQPVISISYMLTDPQSDTVRMVRGFFSLDGGGSWRPAITNSVTDTLNVSASPTGSNHTYAWDTAASGFFGESSNVVFRIEAYPSLTAGPKQAPRFERPFASATTFPFRARGTQVRVVDEENTPQPDAFVFRLNAGLARAQQLIAPDPNAPGYTTDANGYLQGRGQIAPGDVLIALAPVPLPGPYADAYSQTVRLYNTNIITTAAGISGFTVTSSGVQTVTVSAAHPLALFDLIVSLEWDARSDTRFMAQLQADLARASELMFQASHGQAALGSVAIFHDKVNWDYADVRVFASNRVRPSALIGGVSTEIITDPTTLDTVVYGPGQVKIGAVWNRFGNAAGNLSEDWPRTLAHELSHYLFYLEDNYIGVDDGQVVPVDNSACPGLMGDTYAGVWQFQTSAGWLPGCATTLSNQTTGRADWDTIKTFYPALRPPEQPVRELSPGPARLPLAVTEILPVDPITPTAALDVPIFYTVDEAGARVLPSLTARAYLLRAKADAPAGVYDRLVPLGRANSDQVLARGARVGDRLCVFDPPARQGCETIRAGDEQIRLRRLPNAQPDIQFTPVTSRTLTVSVAGAPSGTAPLQAELYPLDDDPLPAPIVLEPRANGTYTGTFTLVNPLEGAYVHIHAGSLVGPAAPAWEAITSFAQGGNAGAFSRIGGGAFSRPGGGAFSRIGGGAFSRPGGGAFSRPGGGAFSRPGGGGFSRPGGGAPVSSAEGDVLLVGDNLNFALGQFLMLQTTSILPPPPSWARLIGPGYRFTTSPSAPNLSGTALSFNYLESDVPPGEEQNIQVYYYGPAATSWRAISTTLDTYFNTASIPNQGPGTYALMTSVRIALPAAGWNNFAYPVPGSRAVGQALASIDGRYTVVYGYEPTDARDPWKVYVPAPAPSWVSDLAELSFGRGYWIYTTQPTDLLLNGNGLLARQAAPRTASTLGVPPATIYGVVPDQNGSTPAAGQPVVARVGGVVCGQSTTRQVGGQIVFAVKVAALDPSGTACGALGRVVTISVAGQTIGQIGWDNTRVLDIANTRVYFPLVER